MSWPAKGHVQTECAGCRLQERRDPPVMMRCMRLMRIHHIPPDKEPHGSAGNHVRRIMLPRANTGHGHYTAEPIGDPRHPFSIPVFARDHRSQSPRLHGMSRGETCTTLEKVTWLARCIRAVP